MPRSCSPAVSIRFSARAAAGGSRSPFSSGFAASASIGDAGARTLTLSLPQSSQCASRLRPGKEYIVYADRDQEGFSLARCSRTREIDDAAADVSYARSVIDGSAPAGTIAGRVVVSVRDLAGRIAGSGVPASDVVVRVSGGGQQDQTLTESGRRFHACEQRRGVAHA